MERIKWFSIIRVLGVCLVLTYHFYQTLLPAGFFGVDVFFTLSGYLITVLIIRSFEKEGTFRFLAFLKRRFLRIFVPLFFAVLLTLPFTLLLSPDFSVGIGQQLIAVFSFVSNYFEVFSGGSYEAQLLPHLYLHTWSLAVEMHFYLLWGVFFSVLAFVFRWLYRKKPETGLKIIKGLLLFAALSLAALSYWYMQILYAASPLDPSAGYFGTLTRGMPFMLGAAAGVIIGTRTPSSYESIKTSAALAISGIVFAAGGIVALSWALDFNSELTYSFGFLAVSLLTILIIRCALVLHGASQRIQEPKALAALSNMSYSIYLFHWPLFIVFSYTLDSVLLAAAATLALSLAFSYLVDHVLQPRATKLVEHILQPHATKLVEPVLQPHATAVESKKKTHPQDKPHSPVLRTLGRASLTLLLSSALLLNTVVFTRAPEISSLEAELYAGNLYQNVIEICELEGRTHAINSEPLAITEPHSRMGDLEEGAYLPNPGVVPKDPIILPIILPEKIGDDVLGGVVILGDSVCMGAAGALTSSIPDCYVNTAYSRNLSQGYDILMQWQAADRLREYVVVALGTNGETIYAQRIEQIIADIQPGTRLIFVAPFDGRWTPSWNSYMTAQYIRTLPSKYSFVTVADWAGIIESQAYLIGGDRIHIDGNTTAIGIYVNCIIDAINSASHKPAKP